MAQRFSAWFNSNSYPWESWEEARDRYELLYGPIKEKKKSYTDDPERLEKLEVKDFKIQKPKDVSGVAESLGELQTQRVKKSKSKKEKEEEVSGFLDTLNTFNTMMPWDSTFEGLYKGGKVGWDEAHASSGLIAAENIAPLLGELGYSDAAKRLKDWGYKTYEEQEAEARATEAEQGVPLTTLEQLRLEKGDPTYKPRTKEELQKQFPDSWESKMFSHFSYLYPFK